MVKKPHSCLSQTVSRHSTIANCSLMPRLKLAKLSEVREVEALHATGDKSDNRIKLKVFQVCLYQTGKLRDRPQILVKNRKTLSKNMDSK